MKKIALLIFMLLALKIGAQPHISAAEYFWGSTDPGQGQATALQIVDGAFDDAIEALWKDSVLVNGASGPILFNIRVKDANQNWGPVFKKALVFTPNTQTVATRNININLAEYYFGNSDPGAGNGTALIAFDGAYDDAIESILKDSALIDGSGGSILFNIRVKDANQNWGPVFKKALIFTPNTQTVATRNININLAEYFFGNTDPGAGNGTALIAFDGAYDDAIETILKDSALIDGSGGAMLFNIRVKDANQNWGPVFKKALVFTPNTQTVATRNININLAEYFFGNTDPGAGNGTALIAFDGAYDDAIESILKDSALIDGSGGAMLFNIRVKDANQNWGPVFKKALVFTPNTQTVATRNVHITTAEYFFGIFDPGEGNGTTILALDGTMDDIVENLLRTSVTWNIATAPTLFNIRCKDINNNWSPLFKKVVFPAGVNLNANLITEGDTIKVCPYATVQLHYAGPNGFNVLWENNQTTNTATFQAISEGLFHITSSFGNEVYYDSIYVKFKPIPNATISSQGTLLVCASSSLYLSTSSGSAYQYQWYKNNVLISGATSISYLPLLTGTYNVIIKDTLTTCSDTSDNANLSFSFSISAAANSGGCNSVVPLSLPSGTGNSYQWYLNNNLIVGATTNNYNANVSGAYKALVTNGPCSVYTAPINVTVVNTVASLFTATGAAEICKGSSTQIQAIQGSGYVYQWSTGDTTSLLNVVPIHTSKYYLTLTYGNNVCHDSVLVQVHEPALTISNDTAVCYGKTVALHVLNASAGTIQWSNNIVANQLFVPQSTNTYTATNSDNLGCSISDSVLVTVQSLPIVQAGNDVFVCDGSSVVLSATGAVNYSWNNGITQNQSFVPTQNNSYIVTGTDAFGCQNKDTVAVTIVSYPIASAGSNKIICTGGNTILTASGGATYLWSNGDTAVNTQITQAGSYYVIATNEYGCADTSLPVTVTVKSLPTLVKIKINGLTTVCEPSVVNMVLDMPAGVTTGFDYQWNLSGVPIAGATDSVFYATASGNYNLTVSGGSNCMKFSNAKSATVKPAPVASYTLAYNTTICVGSLVNVTAPTISGYSYTWYKDGISAGTGASKNFKIAGLYSLVAKLNGCVDTADSTFTIIVNPLPVANIYSQNSPTFCAGDSCVLFASPSLAQNYEWHNGNTIVANTANPLFAVSVAGTFKVMVRDTNNCVSKISSTSVKTKVNPVPIASITALGSTSISTTGNVKLKALPSLADLYQWYKNGVPITGAISQNFIATLPGNYTVAVTKLGCIGVSATTIVTQTTPKVVQSTSTFNEQNFVLSAYPNPVGDLLNITVSGIEEINGTIQVMDALGKVVKSFSCKEDANQTTTNNQQSNINCQLSTVNWSSGVYLVRYKDDQGRTGTLKVVKE